jgi:hypothetical protein
MPESDFYRTAGKLLFRSLCTAGGILAPALTVTEPSLPNMAIALGVGTLSMLTSWRVNMETQEAADRDRARLPEAEVLLRNRDLNLLVEAALTRAIQLAGADEGLCEHRKLIECLAAQVPAYFRDVEQVPLDAFAQDNLPNIALRFVQEPEWGPINSHLDPENWSPLLDDLALRVKNQTGFPQIKSTLAEHINRNFDSLVVAVFREDATGRGPSQGRGWAALTLLFWGRMLSDIRNLQDHGAANQDELRTSLGNIEARLAAKLDELVRWNGAIALDQSSCLSAWLKSVHHQLASKLDQMSEMVGHGLLSPEEFRLAYWTKRRQDPGLDQLWQDVSRAEILTEKIVGRAAEVADFETFLKSPAPWVQFWKGWPGTGKSRLMIEFAKRATAAGYRVFFVSPDVHDLKAALLRIRFTEPVVLLWDDYQGENPDALRVFINLQNPLGAGVKRVITSWPTHNVLGEKVGDPLYAERELQAIVPSQELVSYARQLFPQLSQFRAQRVVDVAESQPEAVLRAILLLLQGTAIDHLPPNLLAAAYDNLIQRLLKDRDLNERAAVKKALVAMALVGSVDLGSEKHRVAFDDAGISDDALGILIEAGTVARDEQVHSISLDGFRSHIVRRSLDHRRADVLSGTPKELATLAQALLAEWFRAIWGICVLASEGTEYGSVIRNELLEALDRVTLGWSADSCTQMAERIASATFVEPDPRQREALANHIGNLLTSHDTAEIALRQAVALSNATVGGRDPRQREALANRIGGLLARHNTAEIAYEQAVALYNVTVVEPDPRKREVLANRIGDLLSRHKTEEIALAQATALCNATRGEDDPLQCEALVNRIGNLLAQYDTADMAHRLAKALCNAAVVEPDPRRREVLANHIGDLLTRHDTAEIALAQAEVLFDVTVVEPDPHRREALANLIGDLLTSHDTAEIALRQAMALVNTTTVEPDRQRREMLANHIGDLLTRHDTAEIALAQAKALRNTTVVEPDPRQREALANRIAELLMRHDIAEIAHEQARVLATTAIVETDLPRKQVLIQRIRDLEKQYRFRLG